MPSYVFSLEASRYRDPVSGRFVSERTVRDWTDTVADAAGDRMVAMTKRLQSGRLSLAEWQQQMFLEIKQANLAAALAAHGGRAATSQADWGFMGSQIKAQMGFVRDWADDIAAGRAPLDGRLLSRARLYGDAIVSTYESVKARDARLRGVTEERNVLDGAAEHCSECPSLPKGWVPLGSLPPIGSRACRVRDRCRLEFRRAGQAA